MPHMGTVSTIQRLAIISTIPCFAELSHTEKHKLVLLMSELDFLLGDVVVREGEPVDSVFVIASGTASVSRQAAEGSNDSDQLLAYLGPGDTIGLSDKGFFSTTNRRTATIITTSEMVLLKLEVKDLYFFLKTYTTQLPDMFARSATMLRLQFVKNAMPFEYLSQDRVDELINKIEEISIEKDGVLFQQGEKINCYYGIVSGQIELMNAASESIATLNSFSLFGEATLIVNDHHHATARASEVTHLLALKHEYFLELHETEDNVKSILAKMSAPHIAFVPHADISVCHHETQDHEAIAVLTNLKNNACYKLSQEGLFLWQQFGSRKLLQEIIDTVSNDPHHADFLTLNNMAGLISKFISAGFMTSSRLSHG
jgi:CRP-like cAMP-binding protein